MRLVAAVGCVVFAGGCCLGGASAPEGTGAPSPEPEATAAPAFDEAPPADARAFVRRAAAIPVVGVCDYYARCCSPGDRSVDRALHDAIRACASDAMLTAYDRRARPPQTEEELQRPLLDAVAAGQVRYDAAAAAACLSALGAATPPVRADCAGPDPRGGQYVPGRGRQDVANWNEVDGCQGVFTGVLADGAPCTEDWLCASGSCPAPWRPDGPPMPRTCRPFLAPDAACGPPFDHVCRRPMECVEGHCRLPGAVGAECTTRESYACQSSLFCAHADGVESGTCTAPYAGGASCANDTECESQHCEGGRCRVQCMGAPPSAARAAPTSADGDTAASVGDVFELENEGVTTTYIALWSDRLGTVHPLPTDDATAVPIGTRPPDALEADEDEGPHEAWTYFRLAEGPAPFPIMTLLGNGTCETRVLRQLEVLDGPRAPEGPVDATRDERATLLEIAPCRDQFYVGVGGVPVVWRAIARPGTAASADLVQIVASSEAENDGSDVPEGAPPTLTATALTTVPDATIVFGSYRAYLVRRGVIMLVSDQIPGELLIDSHPYVFGMDADGESLTPLDFDHDVFEGHEISPGS